MLNRIGGYLLNKAILFIPLIFINCIIYDNLAYILLGRYPKDLAYFEVMIYMPCFLYGLWGIVLGGWQSTWSIAAYTSVILGFMIVDMIFTLLFRADLGKIIIGNRLYTSTGETPPYWRLFIRVFIKYLLIGFCPVLCLVPLFTKDHLALHDILTKTNVKSK